MRSIILMTVFITGFVLAATDDYEEQRQLSLGANGIDILDIDAGAGSLEIYGVSATDEIAVAATIEVPDSDPQGAREMIESDLELKLEKRGNTAVLKAHFEQPVWHTGDSPRVHLVVKMPADLNLGVVDGSGSMTIADLTGDIDIEDGSGSIEMTNVGGVVNIVDGSGSISAIGVGGDISIEDGSGSILVEQVSGSVTIDDGSGSINVRDVREDLIIIDDGSGGLEFSKIGGRVENDG